MALDDPTGEQESNVTWSQALVTGTSGYVGGAVAARLLEHGWRVAGADRHRASDATPASHAYEHHVIDLSDAVSVAKLALRFDSIEHLIHCAGGASQAEVDSDAVVPTADVVEASLADNFVSAVNLIRSFFRPLSNACRLSGDATITLISSINAEGSFGLPAYSGAKAGLEGLMRAVFPEAAQCGIRVNLLQLGTVDHPGVRRLHAADASHFDRLHKQSPLGRLTTLEDVVSGVEFITSMSSYAGQVLTLDAGQTAR
jgi:NAD(P)-dependent dehydrogenase (short-subunit alcohol dehydrogenase family)